MKEQKKTEEKKNVKRPLVIYDLVIFIIASLILLILYRGLNSYECRYAGRKYIAGYGDHDHPVSDRREINT